MSRSFGLTFCSESGLVISTPAFLSVAIYSASRGNDSVISWSAMNLSTALPSLPPLLSASSRFTKFDCETPESSNARAYSPPLLNSFHAGAKHSTNSLVCLVLISASCISREKFFGRNIGFHVVTNFLNGLENLEVALAKVSIAVPMPPPSSSLPFLYKSLRSS